MNNRPQRWLPWKNYDTSATPTCPAFGCVELFGYEFIGTQLVLKGRSAQAFYGTYESDQGAKWYHVFNNQVSVAYGSIGLCTFDLPTWAAVEPGFTIQFNTFLTFGLYYSGGVIQVGSPWKLEAYSFPGHLQPGEGAGWNVYCAHPGVDEIALIGGLRTFMRAANSVNN